MSDFTIHSLECLSNCPITEIFSKNIHTKKNQCSKHTEQLLCNTKGMYAAKQ